MSIRRFYSPRLPDAGGALRLDRDESRHAAKVLRLKPRDRVEVVDGRGVRALAEITSVSGRGSSEIVCTVVRQRRHERTMTAVRLFVAPPRSKHFGSIIRCATELGVARITPVVCEHSVSRPAHSARSHWESEAVAALKQSGNPFLPVIDLPMDFTPALAEARGTQYFGAPEAGTPEAEEDCSSEIGLWVGPEAGFSAAEVGELLSRRAQPVRVGSWILRVETAVPSLLGWLFGRGVLR